MLRPLARFVTRYPRWVLAFWLLQLALALPLAAQVGKVLDAKPDVVPNSTAASVATLLRDRFEGLGRETVVLLVEAGEGRSLDDPDLIAAWEGVEGRLAAIDGIEIVLDYRDRSPLPLLGEDGGFGVAVLAFDRDGLDAGIATIDRIRDELDTAKDLSFALAGGPATFDELERVSERDARRGELFGLPLSLVVLVIAFGALVASALPLLVAVTSITLSLAALYLLGSFLDFAVFTESVVTMLGLATGIDYALLMVSRFREELRYKFDPRVAAERTALTAGRAVAFSGLTVMIALCALLVPPLNVVRSIGVGTIVVLIVSVTVSLTALPALLALLGHRVNRLRVSRREPGLRTHTFWRKRAEAIMRRPWLFTIGGALALLALSVPALRMQVSDPGPLGLSVHTEARRSMIALEALGIEGILDNIDVVVDLGDEGFFTPTNLRAVSRLTRAVEELPSVRAVASPMQAQGIPTLFVYQYYATSESARASELAGLVATTVSTDDRYVLLQTVPEGIQTPRESAALRAEIASAAEQLGLAIQIGGANVFEAEWSQVLYRSFPWAVAMVYLATLVLLGLAFRSLLIPIKSIVLNTLTVGAAYGVITLIFQDGVLAQLFGLSGGLGFIDTSAPIFIFAIVFGLSMDYEVFLVARMVEGHDQGLSDRTAVAGALASTGGVITSAAAIMIVVFSIFIFSEVVLIKTLGVGLSVAILLDATLVRMALVPAVMTLAGRWNWWLPKPLARLARLIDLRPE